MVICICKHPMVTSGPKVGVQGELSATMLDAAQEPAGLVEPAPTVTTTALSPDIWRIAIELYTCTWAGDMVPTLVCLHINPQSTEVPQSPGSCSLWSNIVPGQSKPWV